MTQSKVFAACRIRHGDSILVRIHSHERDISMGWKKHGLTLRNDDIDRKHQAI